MTPTQVQLHDHYPRGLEIVLLMVAPDVLVRVNTGAR